MMLLPGFGSPPKAAAPPPPPSESDSATAKAQADAADEVRKAEKRRKGRSSLMLSGQDGLGEAIIERPEARGGSQLLGG